MNRIYLDHSATTPLNKEVLEKMKPYLENNFGNPSSIHSYGQKARVAVEDARDLIASVLKCSPSEITFTSGGTESDNLALRGISMALKEKYGLAHPHLIVSATEHHAVLDTARDLEKHFGFELSLIEVDKNGVVKLEELDNLIGDNTVLVSVMYVNNEIGTIQPIGEIAAKLKTINEKRNTKILFHTDAVQVPGHLPLDVENLRIDAMSLSAHKFYGPKGVGVLYLKKGTPINSINTGGGQEHLIRSGTENVAGIVGMSHALHMAEQIRENQTIELKKLRDRLVDRISSNIEGVSLIGDRSKNIDSIASFLFKGIQAEQLLIALDMQGIAASSGSACTVGSIEPSHVLRALGYSNHDAQSLVRFSLGKENTEKEIDFVLGQLPELVGKIKGLKG